MDLMDLLGPIYLLDILGPVNPLNLWNPMRLLDPTDPLGVASVHPHCIRSIDPLYMLDKLSALFPSIALFPFCS